MEVYTLSNITIMGNLGPRLAQELARLPRGKPAGKGAGHHPPVPFKQG